MVRTGSSQVRTGKGGVLVIDRPVDHGNDDLARAARDPITQFSKARDEAEVPVSVSHDDHTVAGTLVMVVVPPPMRVGGST